MSVNFNLRRLSPAVVARVRAAPNLTEALCDVELDFDPGEYEREFCAAIRPERVEAQSPAFAKMAQRRLDAKGRALSALASAGIVRDEIASGLHLDRAWAGLTSMIGAPNGRRLVDGEEGEAVGGDVGYGPARLLGPAEVAAGLDDLRDVTREGAEAWFRAYEAQERARLRELKQDVAEGLTEDEFERWAWQPFCALLAYVTAAYEARAWLLKWYD